MGCCAVGIEQEGGSMIRFTTKSGAVYLLDEVENTAHRMEGSPGSSGINYGLVPDGVVHRLVKFPDVVVGESVWMFFDTGVFRLTTPVVSVEEVDE